jgi:Clr5 domain
MDQFATTSLHTSEKSSVAQRWSNLQTVIEELYLNGRDREGKKYTLSDVKSIMKRDYGFDAGYETPDFIRSDTLPAPLSQCQVLFLTAFHSEAQYKYQLRKWKVKKNSNTKAKAGAVCKVYSSRSISGKTTRIKLKGGLTADKLQRQIKAQTKEELALTNNINGYGSNLKFLQPVLHSSRSMYVRSI